MSAHTPGPWEISEGFALDGGYQIEGSDCVIVSRAPWPNRAAESRANARLIAAAPELLAACRMVAGMAVAWQPLTPGDIAEVKAAIAKAEGQ